MPFMKGTAPVRRTLQYLKREPLHFMKEIKVLTLNYNINQKASSGAYEFQFWHFPQIRFNNPGLQLVKFKNMTPTPFMQVIYTNGQKTIIDLHGRSRDEIHQHLAHTFCEKEVKTVDVDVKHRNPGSFGYGSLRWCACEIPGQIPCPAFTELPRNMRGKYKNQAEEQ